MLAHTIPQVKSEKPQPEPKSPSPATSSREIAESEESQSPAENPAAKVHTCIEECPSHQLRQSISDRIAVLAPSQRGFRILLHETGRRGIRG